jgi:hypothetical protein
MTGSSVTVHSTETSLSDHRCCPAAMLPRGRTVPRCSMLPRGRIDCSTGPLFLPHPQAFNQSGGAKFQMVHPLNITQPLGIWSIMATIRWCPIFPKWDSYQPLTNCRSLLVTRSLCHSACLSAGCHAPCVIPTYSNCSSLRDDPINWELASKTILQNPTSLSMQSHAVPYVSDFGALVDPWHWALSYACFVSPSHPHPWCPKGTSFPSNWRLCFALWVMFNLDRGTDCRMTTIINLL